MVILKNLGSEVDSEDIMKKDLATVISARMARMITEIECLGESVEQYMRENCDVRRKDY